MKALMQADGKICPPNLSECWYINNSSSTDDRDPLTTFIAPVAIIPSQNNINNEFKPEEHLPMQKNDIHMKIEQTPGPSS